MQKIRQDKPGEKRPKARKWFRPRSVKKMLIEMERPFVWPEVPDLDKYVALLPCLLACSFVWLVGIVEGRDANAVGDGRLRG
jgi:hypothetical protein